MLDGKEDINLAGQIGDHWGVYVSYFLSYFGVHSVNEPGTSR